MTLKVILFSALLLFSVGCATSHGFNRGELREAMNGQAFVSDEEIKKALSLKPQLPKPFKLGIYFKDYAPANHYEKVQWHWTDADKEKIFSQASLLKDKNEISDVFIISDAITNGTDLKSLRLAAAQHGADALMVVSGANDIDSYTNNLGWTYIALVTTLFVPATKTDVLFMAKAAMWDVRNEFLYLTAESESIQKQTVPFAFSNNEHELVDQAKNEAVAKLSGEISKMAAASVAPGYSPKTLSK
jgi:hypothetical protein